ncbi:hypothetical protein GCM10022419_114670 [Nonomuraea rosea]|uniref:Condensation domain-containing protein n=1 Tax=Nonomuraea rosea TaxID=638574 RepID=A0ABP6ZKH6_9ACTN
MNGPLTWGQKAIWQAVERTRPDDHYFNFTKILEVPERARPLSTARAIQAVEDLVTRHAALRTRLGFDGEPYQIVEEHAEPEIWPGAAPEELEAPAFDYEKEWPLRVGLVTDGGEVTRIVLVFCHMATDGLGGDIALRDLRMLLVRGRVSGPLPPQPLDLARWQISPEGRQVARTAAEHWEACEPVVMFDNPPGAPASPPIWRADLASPALDLALRALAHRHRTSTSTVALTAVAALVGQVTGRAKVAILPIVHNRFRSDTARMVSTLSQEGLFTLDIHEDLGERFRAAGPAALRAYSSAYHDPADRANGSWVQPLACFNDMRSSHPEPIDVSPEEIAVARPLSTLSWPLSQDMLNCRFCVHITDPLNISVTADTRFLPKPEMERFLLSLESTLIEAVR